jgi:short-subunit dehydrogenase
LQTLINHLVFPVLSFGKKNLRGKTILITGASRGLGAGIAKFFGTLEVELILIARNEENLKTVCGSIKIAKATYFVCDFSDSEQVKELLEKLPKIDILINNVGKSICRKIDLKSQEELQRLLQINSFAAIELTANLLTKNPKLLVVNIQSASIKFSSSPFWSSYHISKTILDQWMRALDSEYEHLEIKNIYFPLIATETVNRNISYKNTPKLSVEYAANLVQKVLESNRKNFAPYWLKPVAIISHLMPDVWAKFQANFFKK